MSKPDRPPDPPAAGADTVPADTHVVAVDTSSEIGGGTTLGDADRHTDEPVDLAAIERDLAAVEAALPRLDDGSYWTDEITGEPIPDSTLAADPVARRA